MKFRLIYSAILTSSLALAWCGNLPAQDTDADSGSLEKQQYMLEEVTVTAQRREQSLQDVPVSVTAIDGDRIREGGIMNIADVAVVQHW
jgi:iron complex outermembrane receptor protein